MATGISRIFITGLDNKAHQCYFPRGTFEKTTISDLKLEVQKKTGYEIQIQRLIYVSRELASERNGRESTFGDYGIRDGSNIMLVLRLSGGGFGSGFLPLRFADVSSEDNFKEVKLANIAPDWKIIVQGINFKGTCRNKSCKAKNKNVSIQRGFYDSTGGTCMLNYEITQLECPMCKQTLDKDEIHGVGVYEAKLEVKSKARGSIQVVVNIEARDKYLYVGCMDDRDKVDYEYIILIVTRF